MKGSLEICYIRKLNFVINSESSSLGLVVTEVAFETAFRFGDSCFQTYPHYDDLNFRMIKKFDILKH